MKTKAAKLTPREEKIISVIKDNTAGITLAELAYIMGVASISISRDIKKLLRNGHIKKNRNKYHLCSIEDF